MASWRRCDRCRRVLPEQEFDGDATTCRACLALPVGRPAGAGAAGAVTRRRTTPRVPAEPRPAAVSPGERPALLGVAGMGDLEVRERRARRASLEALAVSHPEEFALLLRDARLAEGLRPTTASPAAAPSEPDGPTEQP